jgi:hypothetical protein
MDLSNICSQYVLSYAAAETMSIYVIVYAIIINEGGRRMFTAIIFKINVQSIMSKVFTIISD